MCVFWIWFWLCGIALCIFPVWLSSRWGREREMVAFGNCVLASMCVSLFCSTSDQEFSSFYLFWDKYIPSLMFSVDRKIPTQGPTLPVGNSLTEFPTERLHEGWDFPVNTEEQWSVIFITYKCFICQCTVQYLLVTSLSQCLPWDTLLMKGQLFGVTKQHWLFYQNGLTRTSLSTTVSKFVEKMSFFLLIVKNPGMTAWLTCQNICQTQCIHHV